MSSRCRRHDDTLAFAGPLDRAAAIALWPKLHRDLDGVRRFDLTAVERVDSAGLALLAELATLTGATVEVHGNPEGLEALRTAYRLRDNLSFAA